MGKLFDPNRKSEIRRAVDGDGPLPGARKNQPLLEPPAKPDEGRMDSGINLPPTQTTEPVDADGLPVTLFTSSEARSTQEDHRLIDAIFRGDIQRATQEIAKGANVNWEFPGSIIGGKNRRDEARILAKTPLGIALELGYADIAELLRQNGAKE